MIKTHLYLYEANWREHTVTENIINCYVVEVVETGFMKFFSNSSLDTCITTSAFLGKPFCHSLFNFKIYSGIRIPIEQAKDMMINEFEKMRDKQIEETNTSINMLKEFSCKECE